MQILVSLNACRSGSQLSTSWRTLGTKIVCGVCGALFNWSNAHCWWLWFFETYDCKSSCFTHVWFHIYNYYRTYRTMCIDVRHGDRKLHVLCSPGQLLQPAGHCLESLGRSRCLEVISVGILWPAPTLTLRWPDPMRISNKYILFMGKWRG